MACALTLGVLLAVLHLKTGTCSRGFAVMLCVFPMLVQTVVLLINGNLGASIAVGMLGLVRLRSIPGTARDIGAVTFALALGLVTGLGYLTLAVFLFAVAAAVELLAQRILEKKTPAPAMELRITVPESLNYADAFDDVFAEYTREASLLRVKTTNMGSMFELRYQVTLAEPQREKEMIDAIRCKNGNLCVALCRAPQEEPVL